MLSIHPEVQGFGDEDFIPSPSYSKDDFSEKLENYQCYLDSREIFWKGERGVVA